MEAIDFNLLDATGQSLDQFGMAGRPAAPPT